MSPGNVNAGVSCAVRKVGRAVAKILAIDDDPDILEALRLYLAKEGHDVTTARNRRDGTRAVAKTNPDLVILDIILEQPDDGITMAQDLRRRGFTNPILMLTSITQATGQKYAKDPDILPVDAFLEKPVRPDVLLEQINALLRRGGPEPC